MLPAKLTRYSNKYTILVLGSIAFFLAVGLLFYLRWQSNQQQPSAQPLTAEELRTSTEVRSSFVMTQLGNPATAWSKDKFLLIDIRPAESFEASHLTGAQSAPVTSLGQASIDIDAKVALYSQDSLELKQGEITLRKMGVTNIYTLDQPLADYQELGYGVYVRP